MSDVAGFLERVGRDARLGRGNGSEFELALASAGFDPEIQDAIRAGSQPRLEALLGVAPIIGFLAFGKEGENGTEVSSPVMSTKRTRSLRAVASLS